MNESETKRREIEAYMQQAQYMLTVSRDNLQNGHYGTSVNRSYYALFYAASALLIAINEPRVKHYGVISAFRQHFVKTGLWPTAFSQSYGRILTNRQNSDYRPSVITTRINAARRFARRCTICGPG